jgi:hypothetical protein
VPRKTTPYKAELARRRAERAKLEERARALRMKAATARGRVQRLDYIARAVELEAQIAAMPLARRKTGGSTAKRKSKAAKGGIAGAIRKLGGG